MRTYKRIIAALLAVTVFAMLCSCTYFVDKSDKGLPGLHPNDGIVRSIFVTMYTGLLDYHNLVGISTSVTLSASEPTFDALLRALFDAEFSSPIATSVIPANVDVCAVSQSGNIIYVTLNKEFVQSAAFASGGYSRLLATYSIVNTLLAYAPQYSVQLLVEKGDNGIGERVTYGNLGISTMPADALADPLSFEKSCVATTEDIAGYAFTALREANYTLASQLMYSSTVSMNSESLAQETIGYYSIITFDIKESYTSYTGDSGYVVCDLTFTDASGVACSLTNVMLSMHINDGVMKLSFDDLMDCLEARS